MVWTTILQIKDVLIGLLIGIMSLSGVMNYDSNGNRITVDNPIVVPYNGTIETSGENYTGNVVILSGAVIGGIPMV